MATDQHKARVSAFMGCPKVRVSPVREVVYIYLFVPHVIHAKSSHSNLSNKSKYQILHIKRTHGMTL